MTPKEALKTKYTGSDEKGNLLLAYTSEQVDIFKKALNELEELKRYPTSDEVCKVLSKEFGHTYYYDEELRDFWCEEFGSDDHMQTWYLSNEPLNELVDYPHLITLIGRFYEGVEKK